jgi:CopG family transcriptional regulator/antitoxin EndoAI
LIPNRLILYDDDSASSLIDAMSKRINIILPDKTVTVLDRVTTKGNRSRFIDRAVRQLIEIQGRQSLREQLKAGYQVSADQDLALAAEWFPLEEEAWALNPPR